MDHITVCGIASREEKRREEQIIFQTIRRDGVVIPFRNEDPRELAERAAVMDVSSGKWFTELEGMEDPYQMQYYSFGNPVDDQGFGFQSFSASENYSSFTPSLVSNFPQNDGERVNGEGLRSNSWESSTSNCIDAPKTSSSSSSQLVISFGNNSSIHDIHQALDYSKPQAAEAAASFGNMNFSTASVISSQKSYHDHQNHNNHGRQTARSGSGTQRVCSNSAARNPMNNKDHVIAERKRREKLTQRFIALSALVPGLKKTDKASVLGDTIKHLKQLQERVKTLEEQTTRKMVESVVSVKKSRLGPDDNETSSPNGGFSDLPLPEIEARVSNKDVLIRIHCLKQKWFAVRVLGEIEKLRLRVVNSSVMPFGDYVMDITVVAQMEDEWIMTAEELVRNLRSNCFSTLHLN